MRVTTLVRPVTITGLVFMLVVAGAAPTAGQAAQPEVEIHLPDPFVVGENEIRVEVDNTDGSADLFSPIVEIPLGSSFSTLDNPDPYVEFDGTQEDRTYANQSSSFRSGNALFVYGQNVPAGESRTYVFTLVVEAAGSRTIEADVRPLYNEPNNVRNSTTYIAQTIGTISVEVLDGETDTPIPDASVSAGGEQDTGGQVSFTLPDALDPYTVSANTDETSFPSFSTTLDSFQIRRVTFTQYDDFADPKVIAAVENASVVDGSSQATTTTAGNAITPMEVEQSFLLDSDAGISVVKVDDPAEIAPATQRDASVGSGMLTDVSTTDGTTQLTVNSTGVTTVTVAYEGHRLGDGDLDGTVDAADAETVATAAAEDSDAPAAADVNGDGEVTALDAMLIAQYADDNRNNDYGRP